ncbi:MAG: hypothetical protein AAGC53_12765 [Actinomycetota bacterium]
MAVAFVALVGVACADEEPVFEPNIITAALEVEVAAVGIESVACPGLADGESVTLPADGGTLTCSGLLNGDPVELGVTVSPALEGEIQVAADIITDLFDVAAAETAAAARLDAELGGAPVVTCAEDSVVVQPGRRIDCRVTAEGGTAGPVDQPLIIVILDADANWEIDLVP